MEKQKELFQKHLSTIRKSSGLTAAALGTRLGVTRQMISALETGKTKMNAMQYHALRHTFDEEIVKYPEETLVLQDVLSVLVDSPEQYSEADRANIQLAANTIGFSICSQNTTREDASLAWKSNRISGITVNCANSRAGFSGSTSAIISAVSKSTRRNNHRKIK